MVANHVCIACELNWRAHTSGEGGWMQWGLASATAVKIASPSPSREFGFSAHNAASPDTQLQTAQKHLWCSTATRHRGEPDWMDSIDCLKFLTPRATV